MLAAALAYSRRGWEVFPLYTANPGACSCRRRRKCSHPGKHPLTRHGVHDATTDEAIIRRWWACWPSANIGIATGGLCSLVVIDVDPANGGEVSRDRLQSLMGSLPPTLTAQTGGGGLHLYYRHPGGLLRNTAGRLPGIECNLPGVDLRGDGGYVVGPPSRHSSGARYAWVDESLQAAPCPAWLREETRPAPGQRAVPTPLPHRGASRYAVAALRAEADAVRHAPMGSRNNRLNRAAFCLGMLVAGGELDGRLVEDELLAAAIDAGLPEPEARASLVSGLRAGGREPRRRAAR
jgi:hypothetical protein